MTARDRNLVLPPPGRGHFSLLSDMVTKSQQMMIDDGLPVGCAISATERKAAWRGIKVKPIADVPAKRKELDPGTVALLREQAAAAKQKKREAKAARKEAAIIKQRRKVKRDGK